MKRKKCDNNHGSKQEWICNKISAGLTICLLHHWDSPHWASEHFLSYQTQLFLPLPQWNKGVPCRSARATSVTKAEHTAPPYCYYLCHFSLVQSLLGQGWPIVLQIKKIQPTPVCVSPCHRPSEKAMAPHSSTLAWKIPWMEEPGRLQSMGSLDTTERLHFHFSLSCIGEGNGNPLQCSCLENPRDGGAWWLPSMGSHRVGHDWSDLAAACHRP